MATQNVDAPAGPLEGGVEPDPAPRVEGGAEVDESDLMEENDDTLAVAVDPGPPVTMSLLEQLECLEAGAALYEPEPRVTLRVEGRDRVRFLQSMLSQDVPGLGLYAGTHALLLTIQGRVVADPYLYALEDHFRMVLEETQAEAALASLNHYLIADKVVFRDERSQHGWLRLQGAQAEAVLSRVFPELSLPSEAHGLRPFQLGEVSGWVYREDHLGTGGYELSMPPAQLAQVETRLLEAGARAVSAQAVNILRVENHRPLAGHELGARTIPLEVGAGFCGRTLSYRKGCYLGQEVIVRATHRGQVNLRLTALTVEEGVAEGDHLFLEGKDVGWVTSVVLSPRRGRVGLGYVHRNARALGSRLATEQGPGVVLHELEEKARP